MHVTVSESLEENLTDKRNRNSHLLQLLLWIESCTNLFFSSGEQGQLADADRLQFCFDRLKSLLMKCSNKEEGHNEYVLWLYKTFWNAVNFTFSVDVLTKIRGAFLIWNTSLKMEGFKCIRRSLEILSYKFFVCYCCDPPP